MKSATDKLPVDFDDRKLVGLTTELGVIDFEASHEIVGHSEQMTAEGRVHAIADLLLGLVGLGVVAVAIEEPVPHYSRRFPNPVNGDEHRYSRESGLVNQQDVSPGMTCICLE